MHENEVYLKAIETYGKQAQITKAIEEMSELIVELVRIPIGRTGHDKIIDEIADVTIMMKQLSFIFGDEECEIQRVIKTKRLEGRLNELSQKKE